jgi:Zn-dependent peptidase ImmA (M78 family)
MESIIPQKFSLGGLDYKVETTDFLNDGKDYGLWNGVTCTISLANRVGADIVSPERKQQTFYHELVHAVLNFIGKEELNNDESFVDSFAEGLYHAIKTME